MKLYKHQQELIDLNPKKYLLPWETGTGKTYGLIALIKKNNTINEPVLIVTIKSDKDKWVKIAEKFSINADVMTKEEFKKATVGFSYKKVLKNNGFIDVKITKPAPNKLKGYSFLIVDEAHFFTGNKSMMYKSLIAYIKFHKPTYLWLATATPCDNNPWKLFCLFALLGLERAYKKFRNYFFEYSYKAGGNYVPRETINGLKMKDEIARWINFLGKAIKIDECVDMPKKILIEEYFELTPEQKRAYKEVKEDLIMTENLRKHQICGGTLHIKEVDPITEKVIRDENTFFKSQKLNRIVELCQEHKKIFIVCKYKNEIKYIEDTLKKKLKDRTVITFTGENSAERPSVAKSTDLMSECIVIANAACSAAYECKTIPIMVFYSYDFSLVNYIQIIGRVRRLPDPEKPIPEDKISKVYLSLIIKNSIDEAVFETIQNKKSFDAAIYNKQ